MSLFYQGRARGTFCCCKNKSMYGLEMVALNKRIGDGDGGGRLRHFGRVQRRESGDWTKEVED